MYPGIKKMKVHKKSLQRHRNYPGSKKLGFAVLKTSILYKSTIFDGFVAILVTRSDDVKHFSYLLPPFCILFKISI